jgi:hypothetical protein
MTTLFKEIPIGQRFKLARLTRSFEWVKIEPIRHESGSVRWNCVAADGSRHHNVGAGSAVILPPYGDTTQSDRQKQRYARLKAAVVAAGWSSIAELETAMLTGAVDVPQKPK